MITVVSGETVERITFTSDGVKVIGELRLADRERPMAAVALSGPVTGVKEQVLRLYSERLRQAGIATLAFDHRGFGETSGRRGHEDTQGSWRTCGPPSVCWRLHPRSTPPQTLFHDLAIAA